MIFILGAFMNWFVRGGGWKSAIYKNKPPFNLPGDYINAIVFGVVTWFLSGSMALAAFASLGMFVGSAPGLGLYVSAMLGDRKIWGVGMLTLRGYVWGLCLALGALIPCLWNNIHPNWMYCLGVILAGMAQGVIYFLFINVFKNIKTNFVINFWTVSEMVHGGFLWSCLLALKS